jgi:hypothetical protein
MKLREITQAQKGQYLSDIQNIILDYSAMIKEINVKLASFGLLHYQQTRNVYTVEYVKENKAVLLVDMKNINVMVLDSNLTRLKELREKYIKDIAPVTAITDPLELSFIEKELKVMKDEELLEYFKENYLDTNICRLIQIEHKARNGYKDGKFVAALPEYEAIDYITGQIDEAIKTIVALRQLVSSMLCFQEIVGDTVRTVMISWDNIVKEVEARNLSYNVRVTLEDIHKYNIVK